MIYQFENFILNSRRRELLCDGVVRSTQPQVYALLELLIQNHDRIVSKDEINEKIWKGRIVSESVVNSRIRSARQAVDDDGKSQRLIRTVHSRGYGFVPKPVIVDHLSDLPDSNSLENDRSESNKSAKTTADKSFPTSDRRSANHNIDAGNVGGGRPNGVSIAISPFINMSGNAEQDFFVNGICQDITTMLTKVPVLSVTAQLSPDAREPQAGDLQKMGREHNVQYILEGSVRSEGDHFRITAKLLDMDTGKHIWAERYERKVQDIFALQDEITREIISALQIQLIEGAGSRLLSSGTSNFEAWEAVLKAHDLCMTRRKQDVHAGRKLIQQALELDPEYVDGWSLSGYSYWAEVVGGWSDDANRALQLGKDAVQHALTIDAEDSNSLGTFSLIELAMGQHDAASNLASRAVHHGPSNAFVLGVAAVVKMFCGEMGPAESLARDALRLSPIHRSGAPEVLGSILMHLGKYEEAAAIALERVEIDPDFVSPYFLLTWYYIEMGRQEDAAKAAENILRLNPDFTVQSFAARQPHRDPNALTPLLNAFRKAGIPES